VNNKPAINNLTEPNEERSRKKNKNLFGKDGGEWSECESLVSGITLLTQLRLTSGHHTRCYHCLTRREEQSVARHSLYQKYFYKTLRPRCSLSSPISFYIYNLLSRRHVPCLIIFIFLSLFSSKKKKKIKKITIGMKG
jgi:hypothetical protein